MSEKLMRYFQLSELKVVRLVCKRDGCGAVVEMPIERLEECVRGAACKVCGKQFEVMERFEQPHWQQDVNLLAELARAMLGLNKDSVKVEIEFALPEKDARGNSVANG